MRSSSTSAGALFDVARLMLKEHIPCAKIWLQLGLGKLLSRCSEAGGCSTIDLESPVSIHSYNRDYCPELPKE